MAADLESGPELRALVRRFAPAFEELSEDLVGRRPAPGKWSPKEVLGHLVDSASNNHRRFVTARWQDDLVFEGYEQEGWVAAQGYADAPWRELVDLWRTFNLHLARVMENTPESVRLRRHTRHNLDRIAWRTVPADESTTLDYFMRDYVGHLRHHLMQVLPDEVVGGD